MEMVEGTHLLQNMSRKVTVIAALIINCLLRGGVDKTLKIPSEIFSPDSGGRVNVSSAMEEIRAHGRMRLKQRRRRHHG